MEDGVNHRRHSDMTSTRFDYAPTPRAGIPHLVFADGSWHVVTDISRHDSNLLHAQALRFVRHVLNA